MNPFIQLRGACYLLVLVAVITTPIALAQRNATSHGLPATIILVTNTNDSGPASLRNALAVAHNGDTIDATGVSGRILLTSGALQTNSFFNNNVRIIGPGAGKLAVDGNATSPVFENFATGVTISGFTITQAKGGAIINHGGGGLTLSNSSVVRNDASGSSGGGISNTGGVLIVRNCTISGNSALNGGGIYNLGGILHTATLRISNSTLSGNHAFNGGAICSFAVHFARTSVSVKNCTISGNSATQGAFIYGGAQLRNTILNVGSSGQNIFGTVTSLGYNLASDNGGGFLTGPGDQINTNPMLGPLQHNGGPTLTHALLPGSPAINAGDPNFTPPPSFDQRGEGYPRVVNGRIDIGAFEVQ